jgi:hypothetical protein
MAIARIIHTGIEPEQYDKMRESLGIQDAPPPGGTFHVAGRGEDGKIKIVEVWETREQAEAWGEKVAAARDEAGFGGGSPPTIEYLEVYNIIKA